MSFQLRRLPWTVWMLSLNQVDSLLPHPLLPVSKVGGSGIGAATPWPSL